MVENFCVRSIQTTPSCDSGSQAQFRVIRVSEKILVEAADLLQHFAAVHRRATVRPDHFFDAVKLALIELTGATSAVLTIQEYQMSGFIYSSGIAVHQDLRCGHADSRMILEHLGERAEPVGVGLGIIIQQSYQVALGNLDALVIGAAEPAIVLISDHPGLGVLGSQELKRAVVRTIVYDDDFEGLLGLQKQRFEAETQKIAAVPVYNHD